MINHEQPSTICARIGIGDLRSRLWDISPPVRAPSKCPGKKKCGLQFGGSCILLEGMIVTDGHSFEVRYTYTCIFFLLRCSWICSICSLSVVQILDWRTPVQMQSHARKALIVLIPSAKAHPRSSKHRPPPTAPNQFVARRQRSRSQVLERTLHGTVVFHYGPPTDVSGLERIVIFGRGNKAARVCKKRKGKRGGRH